MTAVTGTSTRTSAVSLPGGLARGEVAVGEAAVRSLCGHDEEWLVAGGASLPGAARTTALLARTVERLGAEQASADAVRALTVGDREALLWGVRRATVGARVGLVVTCGGCDETLSAELDLDEWAATVGGGPGPVVDRTTVGEHEVRLRPPTGADQEAVVAVSGGVEEQTIALLRLTVEAIEGEAPDDEVLTALAPALGEVLATTDPAAETLIDVACPSCDTVTPTVVDAGQVLVEEAVAGARWLLEEVHVLASRYHWSEDEILSLPTARRRRYLELVDEDTSGGGP